MRAETGHALESGLGGDRKFTTGLEKAVKAASEVAAPLPTARTVTPHPLAAAARALPGQAWGAVKRPLALGALGAAGALAYGMHRQNQQDHDNQQLVYAPLQGAMM